MEVIPHPHNTGFIDPKTLINHPAFSFFEKIKMGGVGSPKMYYQKGIEYFDEVIGDYTDLPLVNIELRKQSLLIRLSIHQKNHTVALTYDEIDHIRLIDRTILPKLEYAPLYGNFISKIDIDFVYNINIASGAEIILATNDNKTINFFEKPIFENKLTITHSVDK